MKIKRTVFFQILVFSGIAYGFLQLSSCAPVFSDLQSARLVGKGKFESTPSLSVVTFNDDGADHVQDHLGLQFGYGLSEKMDLRIRLEHMRGDGGDFNATVFGLGPKIGLVPDRVAAYVPIGLAFGEDVTTSETFEIQPTVLVSLPVATFLEFNPSIKYLITLESDSDDFIAFNFGFGISPKLQKWVIRPEFGLLFNPGDDGHYTHFSVGYTFYH